jgi:hypothetical protein
MTKQLRQRLTVLERANTQQGNGCMILCRYDDNGVLIEYRTGKAIEPDDHRRKLIIHVVRANQQTPRDLIK